VASRELTQALTSIPELDGQLWIGFPLLGGPSGIYPVDAILLSPRYGAVVFDVVEGTDLGDFEQRQDDLVRLLQSRLLLHRELVRRRELQIAVQCMTFAPGLSTHQRIERTSEDYPIATADTVFAEILNFPARDAQGELFDQMLSAIENLSTLRRGRGARTLPQPDSRGARLQALEGAIATLDPRQSQAVIETINGVQRIRGLAGSGKTIVLALKAAYLHAYHPDWDIAVTFNARSLRDQFTRLIRDFFIAQTSEEPNWEKLRVINAWGGRSSTSSGIYAEFCKANGIELMDFGQAANSFGSNNAFAGACSVALAQVDAPRAVFDAILVDEAQDFPPSFLRLCYSMLKDEKRLVYAYDELQNLSNADMPSVDEMFGVRDDGQSVVAFDSSPYDQGAQRDIVLQRCYRNSRPVLVTAHALGFGVYRDPDPATGTGLVQMFDQASLWTDIGYRVAAGELESGHQVTLERTDVSSPTFLEIHSPFDDLIQFQSFASIEAQNQWIADQIEKNLREDGLRYDDIMVVNPDSRSARANLGPLRAMLLDKGIPNHLAGVDTSVDVFFQRDTESITFTGIFRAKGNEAGMVYVVNSEEGEYSAANLALSRNKLFTAITRSKAWVRVVGVGEKMDGLVEEFERAKAADFKLRFTYPTSEQRQELRIVHREVTSADAEEIAIQNQSARSLIDGLEAGKLYLQDLDPELRARLRDLLAGPDA
jgi:superfamily I DNA and RNA helicase